MSDHLSFPHTDQASKIVLIGTLQDRTFRYVLSRSQDIRLYYTYIDVDSILKASTFSILLNDQRFIIQWDNIEIAIDPYASIYARIYDYYQNSVSGPEKSLRCERIYQLQSMLQNHKGRVVPRPFYDGGNTVKPLQTQLLAESGFTVPEGIFTTSCSVAHEFINKHNYNVIYKSSSNQRSIVNKVSPEKMKLLNTLKTCPVFFQQHIQGPDIRLHIVDRFYLAEGVQSPLVDYRYAAKESRHFFHHEMPLEIVRKAEKFMLTQNMPIAGFDFKLCSESGQYYCLEANPNPGIEGYDYRAQGKLSQKLFEYLREGICS